MSNNFATAIILIAVIVGGLYYAIYSDPEYHDHQLFDQAINTFANNAKELEQQFQSSGDLPLLSRKFTLSFIDQSDNQSNITLEMNVIHNAVTLTFGDAESALANQSILLEPFVSKNQVRWKCLGGSALIRLRSKECRLGEGINIQEIATQ